MEFEKTQKVADVAWLQRKLEKVYDKGLVDGASFLDMLLADRITWHCGGMSDPFQPCEQQLQATHQLLQVANQYDVSILFSTKTDNVHGWQGLDPELHSFQLSITNTENRKDLEPGVPDIQARLQLFHELQDRGFKVGIRIQPCIPGVVTEKIIDMFQDALYFTLEGLKLVPQNPEQKDYLLKTLGIPREHFTQMGLLNLKPEIRLQMYQPLADKLHSLGLPYSIADNDLHYLSASKCCCGEPLVKKSTNFNTTALLLENLDYTLDDVKAACGGYGSCKVNHLFTSNRQEGCTTINEFFEKRFNRPSSIFSKGFLYYPEQMKKQGV
jgi:hypothetical protein